MTDQECLFCKIASRAIDSEMLYEDDMVVAFNDINPQAPTHILIIPRTHIRTINDLEANHSNLVGHMVLIAKKLASSLNIAESGYRLLFNCNADGGQAVYHIHLHLVGGRPMTWPPG